MSSDGDKALAAQGAKPETGEAAERYVTPRWVKVSATLLLILILIVLIAAFGTWTGHGPGRHATLMTGEPLNVHTRGDDQCV